MLGLSRNTWFLIGGVLLVVVLYLGFSSDDDDDAKDDASAQQVKKGRGKGKRKGKRAKGSAEESGGVGVGKMCAKIECSEAQLSSFKGMVKEHRKNTSSQRRGLAEAHAKIAAELAEDTIDTAALDAAFADAAAQRAEMDNSARGVLEAMHAKLSGTQREGLAKMVARHGPSLMLSRPAAGSDTPKSNSRSKKGRRKKGKALRSGAVPLDAVGGESGDHGLEPGAAPPLSRAKAGLARDPDVRRAVEPSPAPKVEAFDEPDEPDEFDEADEADE